jgi:hypothetical protein
VFCWAFLALLRPSAGTAQEKAPLRLANTPAFASTSEEPVLLRYKHKTGQVEKMRMDLDMDMRVRQGAQELKLKMTLRMDAKAVVTTVDGEGNMSVLLKITRMYSKTSGLKDVEFDSDRPSDNPDFKGVTAMVGVGIPCKMSPVGKMLETDLEPLRLAVRRAGDAALAKSFEDSVKRMFEDQYVELSETPVKAGDIYKAGTIVEDRMKIHKSYKIRAVSGDKTQVLLEPVAALELGPGAFGGGKLRSQRFDGWILFDLQKGYMSRSDGYVRLLFDIAAEGQTGTMEITTKVKMTSSLE